MKIDFNQELKDFAGEPIKLSEDKPPLTLKDVITIAIRTQIQEDANMTLDQKIVIDRIGEEVYKENGELDTGQATIIKERISKVFLTPAVAGAIRRAIEG